MTSQETSDVVLQQENASEEIEKLYSNFRKDSTDRKSTQGYVKKKTDTLNKCWADFDSNNIWLMNAKDISSSHTYFTSNLYMKTKDLVDKYVNELRTLHTIMGNGSTNGNSNNNSNGSNNSSSNSSNNSSSNGSNNSSSNSSNNSSSNGSNNSNSNGSNNSNSNGSNNSSSSGSNNSNSNGSNNSNSNGSNNSSSSGSNNSNSNGSNNSNSNGSNNSSSSGSNNSNSNGSNNSNSNGSNNSSSNGSNNNNSSGSNNNDSDQNNLIKIEVIIQHINNMIDTHTQLNDDQKTAVYLRNFKQYIGARWAIAKKLHEVLITNPRYDMTDFMTLEDRIMPILMVLENINEQFQDNGMHMINFVDNVKLPKISVPKFDGDYSKWKHFSELFQEMIGSKTISGIQKMIYLKQNMSGDAAKLLQHMQLTEGNYDLAWQALENRYNNPRLIISSLIERILNIDNQKSESAEAVKRIHDTISENINALERNGIIMDNLSSIMVHHIILKKLDHKTHSLYEQSIMDSRSTQQTSQLLKFLEKRFQALEAIGKSAQINKSTDEKQKQKHLTSTALVMANGVASKPLCECSEKHKIYKCPVFLKLSTKERYIKVKNSGKCINCLKDGHSRKDCKLGKCAECKKKHNTLLHFETKTILFGSAIKNPAFEHVFLATVIIHVVDNYGNLAEVRAILDSGSQINVISEKIHNRIGIKYNAASMTIEGIGTYSVESKKRSLIQVQSKNSSFKASLEFFVVKNVTTCQPAKKINIDNWKIPKNVQLADPKFNVPAQIDMIIGGEIFYQLLTAGIIKIGKELPELQNTVFGWVVTGKLFGTETNKAFSGISIKNEKTMDQQLEKFWQVEERYKQAVAMTNAEQRCERFFEETFKRDKEGRFIVRLQFKLEPQVLGNSEEMAVRRFFYLEKRFAKNAELKEQYVKFMDEYENLGHMEEIKRQELSEQHYIIPHHSVLNPSSSTTKFRVVFDASAKTTSNISLNEILENGPILQDDLFSIMVRFRQHTYVFSSDIGKMYRQILVDPAETKWQVIVWRRNPKEQLRYFKLKTLTYGTTCASYLSIKTLHQLADIEQEKFPLASKIAKRDFNVDDVMTGTDDLKEAIDLQNQLINMLKLGGMELHKWCANHPMLLETIPQKKQEVSLDINAEKTETKALGMKWIPRQDKFMLHYNPKEHKAITKRTILSETAQLFDPLGLVNPVIVKAKVFIQELWMQNMDWDELLSLNLQEKWTNYRQELLQLNNVAVPRHMILPRAKNLQLHAFSDASIRAYGTSIYIRSEDENNNVTVHLICSKSRVAPTDPLTLPRLELCGAVLMMEIVKKLGTILELNFDETTYWTDSEIVLSWLYSDSVYKTFVGNRIAAIRRNTDVKNWKYINTKLNPADIISRGEVPEKLINSYMWWHGPEFLKEPKEQWPTQKHKFTRIEEEEKVVKTILLATVPEPHFISRIEHRNSIKVLQRIVAYCLKFGKRSVQKDETNEKRFSIEELDRAMLEIIKYCQQDGLVEDIQYIKKGHPEKSSFSNLCPIIDENGVVRVGGRLKAAEIPYEQKHPAILPKNHVITKLIMEKLHIDNMHVGAQGLLASTRQRYWPIHGKRTAQMIIKQCVLCTRAKPRLQEQIMGDLPAERVGVARAFIHVGIDFAGPIMIHYKLRGKRATKAYICIFVCFSTKAVHIEAAVDQSTDAFINCLKRFIARRNRPNKIFCDNGGAFVGAKNALEEVAALMADQRHRQKVMEFCEDHRIVWQFIPPRSPHFAGLAEASVKSAKLHLTKILHNISLTFEELATVLSEIESILNSRPLTPMSNDPNDLQPLTAGHFLTGEAMNSINEGNVPIKNKLVMWNKIRTIKNEFWKRWQKEYLSELQYRHKWNKETTNIELGTMVTLKEPNITPLKWKFGRVIKTFPDDKGIIRVVDVHTISGTPPKQITLRRAIHEVCPLPIEPYTENSQGLEILTTVPDKTSKSVKSQELVVSTNNNKAILKPEANEFKPNSTKIQAKQQNKKSKKLLVQDVEIKESKTRSGRRYGASASSSNIAIMVLTILALLMGIFGKPPCEVMQFRSNPGLYFEQIGQLSLTNDDWNLVCFLKMDEYRSEGKAIDKIMDQLENSCPTIYNKEYCKATTGQLRHQLNTIHLNHDLIYGFSKPTLSRKKRGWFNGGGRMGKVVLGLMDDEDAKFYNNEIKKVQNNNDHLINLIKNQTTMQEITANIIRRDEERFAKQIKHMQTEIDDLHNKAVTGKMNVFNALAFQALTFITGYREVQTALVNMIMDVYHGKIPLNVITPKQLIQQLGKISGHIPHHLMVPGHDSEKEIAHLYAFLNAKIKVTEEYLIIKIKIPLISREAFKLYHIIPVPFIIENSLHIITPATNYIGVNSKLDHFYMLSMNEYTKCKVYNGEQHICVQIQPLYNLQNNRTQCEISIFLKSHSTINNECKLWKTTKTQVWTGLAKTNKFLFTTAHLRTINIICQDVLKQCTIEGSGIVTLPSQCMIKSNSMEINSHNSLTDELAPVELFTHVNLTNAIKMQMANNKAVDWNEFEIDADLSVLDQKIAIQKASEHFSSINQHDIHHYALSYIMLGTTIVLISAFFIRRKFKSWKIGSSATAQKSTQQNDIALEEIYTPMAANRPSILQRVLDKREQEYAHIQRPATKVMAEKSN